MDTEFIDVDGQSYTVLTNVNGVLVVYGPNDDFVEPAAWPEGFHNW